MKITKRENYRVVVEPRSSSWRQNEKDLARDCEDIVSQIKRHVDDVDSVRVESDLNGYCEHCNSIWTEASMTYNGGCCSKDQENDPEEQTPPTSV